MKPRRPNIHNHILLSLYSFAATALLSLPTAAKQAGLQLSLPLNCASGQKCLVQNYVDIDPTPDIGDYHCGRRTYNGHGGVDFRLLSTRARAPVLAAADGVVRGFRDGVPDRLFTRAAAQAVKGRECGNGVVLDHGAGWETQYCHLRQGSVRRRVRIGQRIRRGAPIGQIGYSGKAQFAHLHLSVRRHGRTIDPFSGEPFSGQDPDSACAPAALDRSLWTPAARRQLPYRQAILLEHNLTGDLINNLIAERGRIKPLKRRSPVLLHFARFMNLEKGDQLALSLQGPKGLALKYKTRPLPTNKATYLAHLGKRARADRPWPAGRYLMQVRLFRKGEKIFEQQKPYTLRLE